MALSRIQLQSSREIDRQIFSETPEPRRMGYARVFFSAAILLFAAFMYYIAMHYVPALSNPRKTIRLATETETITSSASEFDFEEASPWQKVLGPYQSLFALDRSYMRSGESIKIKYEIPEGATVELEIIQCQRIWAVEIFRCKPIRQFSTQKNAARGLATYSLGDGGFYHFRHKVEGLNETDTYRLVWERVR